MKKFSATARVILAMQNPGSHHNKFSDLLVDAFDEKEIDENNVKELCKVSLSRFSGWSELSDEDIKVKDISGEGGNKTWKIQNNKEVFPLLVACHQRKNALHNPFSEQRMCDISQIFSIEDIAPSRIAHGHGWFMEIWEGSESWQLNEGRHVLKLAELTSRIHAISTEWFDKWREKYVQRSPELSLTNEKSHLWWYSHRKEFLSHDLFPPTTYDMFMNVSFFYPRHWLSQKLVTSHGDLHYGNIVCGKNSLKVIDFEYTGVTFLIHDIAFIFQWLDFDCKMPFLRHYLESTGKGMDNIVLTEDDIQEIYLDAETGSVFIPHLYRH